MAAASRPTSAETLASLGKCAGVPIKTRPSVAAVAASLQSCAEQSVKISVSIERRRSQDACRG
eukprot:2675495-Pyramimonas_sp.AAC.1